MTTHPMLHFGCSRESNDNWRRRYTAAVFQLASPFFYFPFLFLPLTKRLMLIIQNKFKILQTWVIYFVSNFCLMNIIRYSWVKMSLLKLATMGLWWFCLSWWPNGWYAIVGDGDQVIESVCTIWWFVYWLRDRFIAVTSSLVKLFVWARWFSSREPIMVEQFIYSRDVCKGTMV